MLIVFGGLPGTGKTTISRRLARALAAIHLRVDIIEQAIRDSGVPADAVGAAGYAVAQALAEANLADGRVVVADCVNPVTASREGWRAVAARASVRLIEVEVVCADPQEHRRRVEERVSDIPGLVQPSWEAILRSGYESWDRPRLVIDSAASSPSEAVAAVLGIAAQDRSS
ncbi:AAA family ATPase [Methylobacterium frigidaeris]|uniref:Adenylyl-sulfate kinase n=1 Tax=Methylobacterium frigidaeris TaxID=2038277 RepID=A0AA37HDR0_9HYPH|nr:AAA family ATPase [Methylobacterium frigidaeris]PIK74518.1 kinase [Methylobacterium frigidaeris]GJD63360.1 Adenylyl-sulfate kinase [Methylobacterium frigidaeris]